jgi:hypothetical protein
MPPTLLFRVTKDGQFAAECLDQAGRERSTTTHARSNHLCDRAVAIAQLFLCLE